MEDFFLDAAASNGVWAALSLALIFFILRAQEKRDAKQDERAKLSKNYRRTDEKTSHYYRHAGRYRKNTRHRHYTRQ